MIRWMLKHALIYAAGCVAALWTIWSVLSGRVSEGWRDPLLILALFWIFGYWGILGIFRLRRKWIGLQVIFARMSEKIQKGEEVDAADVQVMTEEITAYAAEENHLPKFLLRPFIRKAMLHLIERAREDAAQERAAGDERNAG